MIQGREGETESSGPLSKDHVHKKPGIYSSGGRLEKRRNQYEKKNVDSDRIISHDGSFSCGMQHECIGAVYGES